MTQPPAVRDRRRPALLARSRGRRRRRDRAVVHRRRPPAGCCIAATRSASWSATAPTPPSPSLLWTGDWDPTRSSPAPPLPGAVLTALRALPMTAKPMDALRTAVSAWGATETLGWPPTADEARALTAFSPSALAAFAGSGAAMLEGYSFFVGIDGWGSVKRRPGAAVYGALWRLTRATSPRCMPTSCSTRASTRCAICRCAAEGGACAPWFTCCAGKPPAGRSRATSKRSPRRRAPGICRRITCAPSNAGRARASPARASSSPERAHERPAPCRASAGACRASASAPLSSTRRSGAASQAGCATGATESVEAVFSGAPEAVAAVIEACRRGPPGARVEELDQREARPPNSRCAGRANCSRCCRRPERASRRTAPRIRAAAPCRPPAIVAGNAEVGEAGDAVALLAARRTARCRRNATGPARR